MAEESRKRFHWESKENEIPKPRAYYTSNESKKKPLYQFNERALREKEVAKRIDYENYAADEDYRNKPRAYYFKDEAKYVNVPKAKAAKMAEELRRGPKYKFRMIGRHPRHVTSATEKEKAKSPYTGTTWAFVHYKKFSGPWRVNLSAEIIEQVIEGKEKMVAKQAALEETGAYPLKHKLENRTTFVLPTWRNFIHDVKDFRPYTFKDDPIDKQLDHIDSIYIPSEEVTVPANWNDWIMPQLIEYRKKYRGLTVQEPFAHYPQYSWENIGFDINKLEDPLPPIWPLEKAQFNADVMREHMRVTAEPPVAHDDAEWDSQGREKRTIFVPPTRRVIIPGHPDYFI